MSQANSIKRADFGFLIGQKFGRLTVIGITWEGKQRGCKLRCRCECGKEKVILKNNVVNNRKYKTVSCGCKLYETKPDAVEKNPAFKSWMSMIRRCHNQKDDSFGRYGARGIVVCNRWRNSFFDFLGDMGPRPSINHSIDRIDNNGNYEPGNCRWATSKQQGRNRRTNRLIECFGLRLTLAEWSERTGIFRQFISLRLQRGWSIEEALTISTDREPTSSCPQGHEYNSKNTYIDSRGSKHCRICNLARYHIKKRKQHKQIS